MDTLDCDRCGTPTDDPIYHMQRHGPTLLVCADCDDALSDSEAEG